MPRGEDLSAWLERPAPPEAVAELAAAGYGPPLFARLLAARGVAAANAESFFSPSAAALARPSELPGMDAAADAVFAAVRDRRKIVVFGDYDCDGICATAILLKTLRTLGADAAAFIPDRLSEGYGMGEKSVARMLAENPGVALVVTVDNGIGSADRVAALKEKGVAVVVTDHHLPGDALPDCPVLNPKVAAPPHLEWLCGAGVAFLLAYALVERAKAAGLYAGAGIAAPLIVLAGLATVTDIMPLRDQNRILVAEALRRFRVHAPVGLVELLSRAAKSAKTALCSRDFGFIIGPRMNAAGRMASALDALELVMATDREAARERARVVDLRNIERKTAELKMSEAALAQIAPGAPAQVIDLADGHQGVAGIVAARVLEKISESGAAVPVCVAVRGHGSARAPDGFNVRDALAAASDHLVSFGGHAAAGGYVVREGEADAFRAAFARACAAQAAAPEAVAAGAIHFDAWVKPSDLTVDFVKSLARLEPFGEGNPEPVFALRGVLFTDAKPIGEDGKHARFRIRSCPDAVWWNHGSAVESFRAAAASRFDLLFSPFISDYGEPHVELRLIAARPAAW